MEQRQRTRLVKLLGMLGSTHDGEIAAAARKVQDFVKKSGLTWQEVLDAQLDDGKVRALLAENAELRTELERRSNAVVPVPPASAPAIWQQRVSCTVEEAVEIAIEHSEDLTDWEQEFVASFNRHPTERQLERLADIVVKLERLARMKKPKKGW